MLLIVIFVKGSNLSFVYPIIYGAGAILTPTIIGWLFFKEVISATQGIGLILIFIGIITVVFSKTPIVLK